MAVAWIFVIMLNLPSFGGEVVAEVKTTSLEACLKLRKAVTSTLGGENNINGEVTRCYELLIDEEK